MITAVVVISRYFTWSRFTIKQPFIIPFQHKNHQCFCRYTLQWRHNERDGVSNQRRLDHFLNRLIWANQRKYESSVSLAFVRGIHRWPVNSPHKEPVTRKMFPFHYVILIWGKWHLFPIKKPQLLFRNISNYIDIYLTELALSRTLWIKCDFGLP